MSSKSSWKLGLHIDSTLAEFAALHSEKTDFVGARYYLPKSSLETSLADFKQRAPQVMDATVQITSSLSTHLFERRAGEAPAMLVTSGFEGWPFLRQPGRDEGPTMMPTRTTPLLSPDLVFGVSERTSIHGEIIESPKTEEIDFLISKLQFSQVKAVCVCFLHSTLNPQNETWVAEKLKASGFEVVCSSSITGEANEVPRWWRAFSHLYLSSSFSSTLLETEKVFETQGFSKDQIRWLETHPVDSSAGRDRALASAARKLGAKGALYLGFDVWRIIDADRLTPNWITDLGPIYCPRPDFVDLRIQPTIELSMTDFGIVAPMGLHMGLDPGPSRWGRSLRPTVLDAILPDDFEFATGLSTETPRLGDSLNALSRTSKMSREVIKDAIMDLIDDQWRLHLKGSDGKWLLAGPLAKFFASRLREIGYKLELKDSFAFGAAAAAAISEELQ